LLISFLNVKEEVWVKDSNGNIFGRGFFNPYSQYRVRLMATSIAGESSSLKDSNSVLYIPLKELITQRITEGIDKHKLNLYFLMN